MRGCQTSLLTRINPAKAESFGVPCARNTETTLSPIGSILLGKASMVKCSQVSLLDVSALRPAQSTSNTRSAEPDANRQNVEAAPGAPCELQSVLLAYSLGTPMILP